MRRHQQACNQYLRPFLYSCLIIIISLSCVECLVCDAYSSVLSPCPRRISLWASVSLLCSLPCVLCSLSLNFCLCHCGSLYPLLSLAHFTHLFDMEYGSQELIRPQAPCNPLLPLSSYPPREPLRWLLQ